MKKSKLISIIGAPCSGKSVLATDVQSSLKIKGFNSIIAPEAATDFISEYGVPDSPIDQMVIFYKQIERERMYLNSKEYVICDSSSLLNYFYFRSNFKSNLTDKNIAAINHLQKEILKSLNSWSYIFYVNPILESVEDGIRFQNVDEIKKIDRWIKSYLEMENIPHIDLTNIPLNDRKDYIIKEITN